MDAHALEEGRPIEAIEGYAEPGELLVCPYCLGLWVVAGFSLGLLFAPRLTRFLAAVFSALTISDFLQVAYKAAEEKGLG